MLYDILFIDDDFEEGNVEPGKPETTNLKALKTMRLFSTLIGVDNLRVTYTTGELDDIERLESKDLSCIKFIFCDLHLIGVSDGSSFKIINSKIINIFTKLNTSIKSDKVVININSKYFNDSYGDDGLNDLKTKLSNDFSNKYSVEAITKKNELSPRNKKELIKNSINIYSRQLILNKAIEIEKIFDQKLKLSRSTCEKLSFDHKYLVFQSQYKLDTSNKDNVLLLEQIRNKLAHTNGEIQKIKDDNKKKLFWKNCSDEERDDSIEFKSFGQLMKYIESINKLIENLKEVAKGLNKNK